MNKFLVLSYRETHWNPITANMLAVVFSNGALTLHTVNDACTGVDTTALPPGEHIQCMSWSPKGMAAEGLEDISVTSFLYLQDMRSIKVSEG